MLDKKNTLNILILVIFLTVPFIGGDIFAQITLPDDGEVIDAPTAPIGQFIGLAIAIGSYIGFKKLNKHKS